MIQRMSDASIDALAAALDVQTLRVVQPIADEGSITAAAACARLQPAGDQPAAEASRAAPRRGARRAGGSQRAAHRGRAACSPVTRPPSRRRWMPQPANSPNSAGCAPGACGSSAFPSASPTVVPRLLAASPRHHPGIDVTYVEAEPPEAVEAVREDRADIALTFSYPGDRDDPHGRARAGSPCAPSATSRCCSCCPSGTPPRRPTSSTLGTLARRELDRRLPALPRAPARALRARRLRAAHRVRDRQLRRRRGPRRPGDRRGDAAALAVASFPQLPDVVTRPLRPRRGAHAPRRDGARRRPRARRRARHSPRWNRSAARSRN